jgi:hypothetical protein
MAFDIRAPLPAEMPYANERITKKTGKDIDSAARPPVDILPPK